MLICVILTADSQQFVGCITSVGYNNYTIDLNNVINGELETTYGNDRVAIEGAIKLFSIKGLRVLYSPDAKKEGW